MSNLSLIEEYYEKYINNLSESLPDGIIEVDIALLSELDLLNFDPGLSKEEDTLTRYFHVIESIEKITLINDDYVIWIVPDYLDQNPVTFTLIALNAPKGPQLETAFCTSGVYNSSGLVLRVLDKFIREIQETQSLIQKYERAA
jgi:hypothetical protein